MGIPLVVVGRTELDGAIIGNNRRSSQSVVLIRSQPPSAAPQGAVLPVTPPSGESSYNRRRLGWRGLAPGSSRWEENAARDEP